MIPSTIPNRGSTNGAVVIVAPGASMVGQAHILTEFSKPFKLAGLFRAAGAGAFDRDMEMEGEGAPMADDTQEGHEAAMVTDKIPVRIPVKQLRSRGLGFVKGKQCLNDLISRSSDSAFFQTPKRFRRAKDLSAYEAAAAESYRRHLRRLALKRDGKWVRRAAMRMLRRSQGGMEVVDGLQNAFMAGIDL